MHFWGLNLKPINHDQEIIGCEVKGFYPELNNKECVQSFIGYWLVRGEGGVERRGADEEEAMM